jgi:copper(I)-binding protein
MKRFALALLALLPVAALAETSAGHPPAAAGATLGDLAISGGFVRAMLPNQPVGGGYFTVHNAGTAPDRLVGIATPLAGSGEVHEMSMQGAVMTMRALPEGVEIPAGGTVVLQPGGLHLMFMQVATPFKAGSTVPVTLTFQKAGKVELALPVLAAGEMPDAHAGMHAMPDMKP